MRLQYGQLLNALRHVRPDDLDLLFTGGAFSKMLERLGRRDNIVTIAVDAYWMGGGTLSRPRPHLRTEEVNWTVFSLFRWTIGVSNCNWGPLPYRD